STDKVSQKSQCPGGLMTLRKAWRWRLLAFAVGSGALAASASCMRRVSPDSGLSVADTPQVQSAIRIFRKLIGRDPGPKELQALKDTPYQDAVKKVLNSAQFDTEGFYHLHRERFLLNREGSEAWVKASYNDYCALRLEMAEAAQADREGKYFDLLRYE